MPDVRAAGIRRRQILLAALILGALTLAFNATQGDAHHRCWHKSRDCAGKPAPDSGPPQTTITSSSTGSLGANSATFTFESTEPNS